MLKLPLALSALGLSALANMTYPTIDGGTMVASDFSLDTTWHLNKITCSKSAYFIHMILCWVVFLTGIGAMVTRVWPQFKWLHSHFGRAYVIAMLWNTATSLLIHNTGLPVNTVILFAVIMINIAIAWPLIKCHEKRLHGAALQGATRRLRAGETVDDLEAMINEEKMRIVDGKSFNQRMWSLKAAHGILMFITWGNIAGRIMASNQSGDFECYTYPVYKPITTFNPSSGKFQAGDFLNKPLMLVPLVDPDYARLPWASLGEWTWSFIIELSCVVISMGVGAAISYKNSQFASSVKKETHVQLS